jgi:hypothetical protein
MPTFSFTADVKGDIYEGLLEKAPRNRPRGRAILYAPATRHALWRVLDRLAWRRYGFDISVQMTSSVRSNAPP